MPRSGVLEFWSVVKCCGVVEGDGVVESHRFEWWSVLKWFYVRERSCAMW